MDSCELESLIRNSVKNVNFEESEAFSSLLFGGFESTLQLKLANALAGSDKVDNISIEKVGYDFKGRDKFYSNLRPDIFFTIKEELEGTVSKYVLELKVNYSLQKKGEEFERRINSDIAKYHNNERGKIPDDISVYVLGIIVSAKILEKMVKDTDKAKIYGYDAYIPKNRIDDSKLMAKTTSEWSINENAVPCGEILSLDSDLVVGHLWKIKKQDRQ